MSAMIRRSACSSGSGPRGPERWAAGLRADAPRPRRARGLVQEVVDSLTAAQVAALSPAGFSGLSTADLLDPLSGTLLLLGYGAVFAAVAIATSLRRDID